MPPGSSDDAFGALGAPVGRIFFAGAETIPGQSGTVHGAWRSGERAAEEVDSWLEAEAGRIGGTPAERPAATAHRHGLSFPRTLSGRDCLSCHGS
jgi:hypothetical protein